MKNTTQHFVSTRMPFFTRCFRWLFSRKPLILSAWVVTVVVLFYAEENWRARREWEKFRREGEAKGEIFDLAAILPRAVPDDQNFAMAPFFDDMLLFWKRRKNPDIQYDTNRIEHLWMTLYRDRWGQNSPPVLGGWLDAKKTVLADWQSYYRTPPKPVGTRSPEFAPVEFPTNGVAQSPAADVQLALSKFDDVLSELRLASRRPNSRFPINYEDNSGALLPHLNKLKQTVRFLQLRAVDELEAGKTDSAAEDADLCIYLAESIKTEPILISQLVRFAMWNITLDAVWEGLADHRWSDEQLRKFQEKMKSPDLLADWRWSIEGERCLDSQAMDELGRMRTASPLFKEGFGTEEGDNFQSEIYYKLYIRFAPRGWFERNKLLMADILQQQLLMPVQAEPADSKTLFSRSPSAGTADPRLVQANPYNYIARWLTPAISRSKIKAVRAQTALHLAATACALERYWLAHGEYPETLGQLTPQFIAQVPREIVNDQPLKYRRTDNGRFILYSTGLEGTDFGGESLNAKGKSNGNWVWRYPAK